ncbi:MAG: HAMP domain-containing histidine kinase [Candidatus Omnitrophica bacterium]|nr:HAMP domain-containing histidine kinase [Candidatus Omnitrophota bacterium]
MTVRNIRVRLITWYVVSLGLVHGVVGTSLYHRMSARLYGEFDEQLAAYTGCLVELLPQHKGIEVGRVVKEMADLHGVERELYVHITDGAGKTLYDTAVLPLDVSDTLRVSAEAGTGRPVSVRLPHAGRWRALRQEVREDGRLAYVGTVAMPLRGVQEGLWHLLETLVILVPIIFLVASIGAWVLLNRALAPLRHMIDSAQAIQADNVVDRRIPVPATGDEVERLANTFNEMAGRLHRSFAQMRQFTSDASHELRTPLAVLKGEIETGISACPVPGRCQETLQNCMTEIDRLTRLIDGLLLLSRADGGRLELERESVSLSRLIHEMAEDARLLGEAKQLEVDVVNGRDIIVRADEMRLKQLLLNLVDNAVKYTPERGRIILGYWASDEHVELTVKDTGIGIAPEHLPHIFDRFYRVDQSRDGAVGGHGLGLAICQMIAEAHGGTIRVESTSGQGTAFRIRLPLA